MLDDAREPDDIKVARADEDVSEALAESFQARGIAPLAAGIFLDVLNIFRLFGRSRWT